MDHPPDVEMIIIDDSASDSAARGDDEAAAPITISSRASSCTIEEETSDTSSLPGILDLGLPGPQVYMVTETWSSEFVRDHEGRGFRVLAVFDTNVVANQFAERYARAVEARANRRYEAEWRETVQSRWKHGTFGPDEKVPDKKEACLEQLSSADDLDGVDRWIVYSDRVTSVQVSRWNLRSNLAGLLSDRLHVVEEDGICLEEGDVDGTYVPRWKELDSEGEDTLPATCTVGDKESTSDSEQNLEEENRLREEDWLGDDDLQDELQLLKDDREKPVHQVVAEAMSAGMEEQVRF